MSRPAAVIFDLFGTLVGFSAARLDAVFADMANALGVPLADYQRACARVRVDWEAGAFDSVEAHAEHVCRSLARTPDPCRVALASAAYFRFTRRALQPRDDAIAVLRRLRDMGPRLGLITNCSSEVPLVWPRTPLAPLFDAAVFSCDVQLRKPDPRIYALTCERLGVRPMDCVYVGDGGSAELSGAARMGMRSIQLITPGEDPRDAERLGRETWSGQSIRALGELVACIDGSLTKAHP